MPFLRKHLAVTFSQTSNLRAGVLLFDHGLLNYTAIFVTLRIVLAYFRKKTGADGAELSGGEKESYPTSRSERVRHVKPSAFFRGSIPEGRTKPCGRLHCPAIPVCGKFAAVRWVKLHGVIGHVPAAKWEPSGTACGTKFIS